jgi:small-conductance mechanosensitive channel/CRP-like cAMP-binding protein
METGSASLLRQVWAGVWHADMPTLLVMVVLLAAPLFWLRREDRTPLAHTLIFYVASILALAAGEIVSALGLPDAGAVLNEAATVAGGIAIIRLWGMFLFRLVLPRVRIETPRIVEDIVVMLLYVAWGMVRLRYAGLDLSQIVTTSALITAVLAFAMQDTLGNILGGIALELDSSLGVGDWVRIDDVEGEVLDIRWRSTSIQTRNWDTVVVPNSYLMRNRFTIHGRRRGEALRWRRWVWFNVNYAAQPAAVIECVEQAMRGALIPRVATDPAPQCLLMEFEHGYCRYALRYWLTDFARDDATDSDVRVHVLTALQRAGLRIAVPEYSIHTIKEGEKHLQAVHARELQRRLAALRQVELFSGLGEEERRTVGERLVAAPFAAGDIMTRQGAVAHWLYILVSGEADIVVDTPAGEQRTVARLHPGVCFGEMGLLTGEPRRATVIARTTVECYRLDKASLEDILRKRPALAEEFSRMLEARLRDLDAQIQQADAEHFSSRRASERSEILASIRRFFGLDH